MVDTARRRRINTDPHPDLTEAITVTRFWSLVRRAGDDECWEWSGDRNTDGYGVFFYRQRMHGAHELAMSFSTGEKRIDRLDTCHSCDNPPCCNPRHLRFDTRASNVDDMLERGRGNHGKKLTAEDVVLMRERRAAGARQKDLAEHFGVTDGLVSEIVRGLRWPNTPGPIETKRKYIRG